MGEIKKRRTEITVETRTVTIIRTRNADTHTVFCVTCNTEVTALPLQYAALIFRVNESELELFVGSGDIHTAENTNLCGNSLANFFKQEVKFIED